MSRQSKVVNGSANYLNGETLYHQTNEFVRHLREDRHLREENRDLRIKVCRLERELTRLYSENADLKDRSQLLEELRQVKGRWYGDCRAEC